MRAGTNHVAWPVMMFSKASWIERSSCAKVLGNAMTEVKMK